MRQLHALIWLFLFANAAGPVSAGEISPALAAQMAGNDDAEPMTVLVVLRDGIDIKALDLSLHEEKAPLATRHRIVVESLRAAAGAAQADLVSDLGNAKSSGRVLEYRAYWIINAVRVKADEDMIRSLAARSDVEVVEPDLRVELIEPVSRRSVPAGDRDALGIGITPGVVSIGTRRVWEELGNRGEGTLIGSLDTGVDGTHPALADRWRGLHAPWQECWFDVISDTTQFPYDDDGHGTHCTGTMTGLATGDTIGVAPAAEWIAANPINQGLGIEFPEDIIACFEWFTDPDGDPLTMDDVPDVVQNSWGVHTGLGYPQCYSYWWDVIDACEAAGPVLVFAAGNEGAMPTSLRSPADRATSPTNCFSVGATEYDPPFAIANFSSRGPAGPACGPEEYRIKPEVSAPGVDIYSAAPGGGYAYLSGTSMATPHVCGVVALMRAANPDADVITIKEVLMGTCSDLGAPGEDNNYGHGIVDAYEAVTQVMDGFGNVEGYVLDAVTSDPVPGTLVQVPGSYWTAISDETGFYTFRLPVGAQSLEATAYSYAVLNQSVTVAENETLVQDLVLSLQPRVTVSGTVFLPGANPVDGGTPAANAGINIENVPESPVSADEFGQYAVSLPMGTDYVLTTTAGVEGHLTQTIPFHQDLDLDLFLNAGNSEGFESGDFSSFGWLLHGAADWTVQGDEVHSGDWAARSGAIGDGEYSQLANYVNCGEGGEMTFWFKISSESGDDFLRFYVANALVGEWSGEMDWTQATFPVNPGTNHIRVRYQKGSSGFAGADAAWVDDMIFPGLVNPAPKLVISPVTVAVDLDTPGQVTAPGYLFNMGGEDLSWLASETADWLTLSPTSGIMPLGSYQQMDFTFDAAGLLDGVRTAQVTVDSDDPANPVFILEARMNLDTEVSAAPEGLPRTMVLHGAVPNPFNPATVIRFTLPANQQAVLGVYDVRGYLVNTLVDGPLKAGLHEARWDGRDMRGRAVSSGTYFARLKAANQTEVKSLTLVR